MLPRGARATIPGTTPQRRAFFWIAVLVGFAFLLWLLSPILLPFVLGMAIAYFLDPLVAWLERHGVSRSLASGGILISFFLLGLILLLLGVPAVVEQLTALTRRIPQWIAWARQSLVPIADRFLARVGAPPLLGADSASTAALGNVAGIAGTVLQAFFLRGLAMVNILALLAVTPLVAFYLLRDWPKVLAEVDGWLPQKHADVIREQGRRIDEVLAGFARGAAAVCLILGAFYALALTLAGLEFGLLIGLSAGALSFVPYVGAAYGLLASVGVALFQFWPDWFRIAIIAAVFFVGQLLFDYVLTPQLVGDRVGLHPLWVMFGVFAGGALFGFVGILLAVPACAVIGVLVRFAIGRYRQSAFYLEG